MSVVSVVCCDELITRPEESYLLWCVFVCDLETSRMGAPYIYIYDISRLRVKGPILNRTPPNIQEERSTQLRREGSLIFDFHSSVHRNIFL